MNKQNKKIAQEKRRIEREKAERLFLLFRFDTDFGFVINGRMRRNRLGHRQRALPVRKLHHRPQNLRHQRHKAVIHRPRQQH